MELISNNFLSVQHLSVEMSKNLFWANMMNWYWMGWYFSWCSWDFLAWPVCHFMHVGLDVVPRSIAAAWTLSSAVDHFSDLRR